MRPDYCEHCIVRGDVKECEKTPCHVRNSWYVDMLLKREQLWIKIIEINGIMNIGED